jgi:hypothetical protein
MSADLNGFRKDRDGAYIVKDPQSILDYSVDWSDWLVGADAIDTSVWTVSTFTGDTAPLEEESASDASGIATVILSGGTAGKIYTVTNNITTTSGLVDERYFRIVVKNKSA